MKSPVTGREMSKKTLYVGKSHTHPEGIEIDVCDESGGIWLDSGELTKLETIVEEIVSKRNSTSRSESAPQVRSKFDDDDDDYNPSHSQQHNYNSNPPKRRKESILGEIFDIF